MAIRKTPAQLQQQVDAFNARYPIGQSVAVRKDGGEDAPAVTRSEAQVLSGHSAVIWLEGISGCYLLDRVTVMTAADREAAAKVRPYSHNSALILAGERDGADIVQAAAHTRLATRTPEAEPVAWGSPEQIARLTTNPEEDGGVYLPLRSEKRGLFTMPLYAHPPQTDTRSPDAMVKIGPGHCSFCGVYLAPAFIAECPRPDCISRPTDSAAALREATIRECIEIVKKHADDAYPAPDRYAEVWDDCAKFICGDIEVELKRFAALSSPAGEG